MSGAVLELQTAEACNLFSVTAGDGNAEVSIVAVNLHTPYKRGISSRWNRAFPMDLKWEEKMQSRLDVSRIAFKSVVLLTALMIGTLPGLARDKYETIDATAFGTGTQLGQNIGVTLMIYEFSTPADRAILAAAFEKGQNQGLVNALQKMRTVGRVEFTGTLGNDCAYIAVTPTATGRHIVFVTNRQIRFGEAWTDSQTMSYDLTAGILDLNDQDKSKSTGTVYPLAQLVIDKQGKLQWDLNQNPWRLSDVIDWKGSGSNN
jgi:hypothetical protein